MYSASRSLGVGKYADVIVLDGNIFEIPVEEIYSTKVLLTILEGRVVYTSPGSGIAM